MCCVVCMYIDLHINGDPSYDWGTRVLLLSTITTITNSYSTAITITTL